MPATRSVRISLGRRSRVAGLALGVMMCLLPAIATAPASAATGGDLCAQAGSAAGFRGETLVTAVAIALAESGCNPAAANPSGALGLWQIHAPSHPAYSIACLQDPQCNATAAFAVSRQGATWSPWTVFTTGAYTSKVAAARAAVARLPGQPGALLAMDQWLRPNQSIVSASGTYELFMQGDGNLVLYRNRATVLFQTRTSSPGASFVLQSDGNAVVYSAAGTALWASYVDVGPQARLVLHDSGNLVEYAASGAIVWYRGQISSSSPPPPQSPAPDRLLPGGLLVPGGDPLRSTNGAFTLHMQGDGNLVLYSPTAALWAVRTEPASGAFLALQGEGKAVLYDARSARWWTETSGNPSSWLVIQNDGNLVLYSADGKALWWSTADTAHLLR